MSNKDSNKLNELDILIRSTVRGSMEEGTLVTIKFNWGFEFFNDRPYHNYETWSGGYSVEGRGQKAAAEDLDDAIKLWSNKVKSEEAKNNEQ